MSRTAVNDEAIVDYALAHSTGPDEVLQSLIDTTSEAVGDFAMMQISPLQGAFMSILTASLRPMFAVEVGTFTGYSALVVAKALPEGGRLLCCDVSEEWTAIGRDHWEKAGVADRIDLRIAPALDTLRSLPADPAVDLAFIDADKSSYQAYYEELLPRLSDTGVILVDNTFWSGAVLDLDATDDDTVALRAFNDHVAADPRSEVAQLPIGDGVTMIRRVG
jgi:caffeoyl-CoA O-methyltransferase